MRERIHMKERIANGLADFADHGGVSYTLAQARQADEIRKRFDKRETAIGTRAIELLGPDQHPLFGEFDVRYRAAASLLLSNRGLP